MSTRPSASMSATALTRTIGTGDAGAAAAGSQPACSAPVAAIDVDVAVGQVAGPHDRPALADAEIDLDQDLAALHMGGDRGLVVAGDRRALVGHRHAADADREAIAVGLLASLADGHDDAPPIGITGGDPGLDQGRG